MKKGGGGGELSPCNTEDDCFASSRSLDRDVSRWRSLATRLRFRPESRIGRSLAATRLRFRPKVAAVDRCRTACKAVITGDTLAKQR